MKRSCLVLLLAASVATPVGAAVNNEVRVVSVQPDVQFHKGGSAAGAWLPVEKDTILKQGDELTVDPDGSATLAFADNSTVVVRNTTQLKIASFFTDGGVVKTEILLKMGEVAAQVNHSEATKSDFRIKSPTGTASVRGTKLEKVSYNPTTGMSVKIVEGSISLSSNTGTGSTRVTVNEVGNVTKSGDVQSPTEVHRNEIASNAYVPGQTAEEIHHYQENVTPLTGGTSSSSSSVFDIAQVATEAANTSQPFSVDLSNLQPGVTPKELVAPIGVTNNAIITTGFAGGRADGAASLVLFTSDDPNFGFGAAAIGHTFTAPATLAISFDHNFVTTEDPNQFFSADDEFKAILRTRVSADSATELQKIQLVRQSVLSTPLQQINPGTLPAFMNLPGNTPPDVAFQSGFQHFEGTFNVPAGFTSLEFLVQNAEDTIVQSAVMLNNIRINEVVGTSTLSSPQQGTLTQQGFTAQTFNPAMVGTGVRSR